MLRSNFGSSHGSWKTDRCRAEIPTWNCVLDLARGCQGQAGSRGAKVFGEGSLLHCCPSGILAGASSGRSLDCCVWYLPWGCCRQNTSRGGRKQPWWCYPRCYPRFFVIALLSKWWFGAGCWNAAIDSDRLLCRLCQHAAKLTLRNASEATKATIVVPNGIRASGACRRSNSTR